MVIIFLTLVYLFGCFILEAIVLGCQKTHTFPRKSRELFGPRKPVAKRVFNVRKSKRIAKFDGIEGRRCENIKRIVAPEIGPRSFGTFEKQGPAPKRTSHNKPFSNSHGWTGSSMK